MRSETPSPPAKTIHFPTEGFALDIGQDCLRVRTTDYHTDPLVLFWDEFFDFATGLGIEIPRGGRPH
jgi:hypothetical protein